MTNKDRFADYVGHDRQSAIIRVDGPPRGTLHLTSLSAPVCKESRDTMAYLVFFHKGRLSTSNKTTHTGSQVEPGTASGDIWWTSEVQAVKVMKNIHMEKKVNSVSVVQFIAPAYVLSPPWKKCCSPQSLKNWWSAELSSTVFRNCNVLRKYFSHDPLSFTVN